MLAASGSNLTVTAPRISLSLAMSVQTHVDRAVLSVTKQ